MGVRLPPSAPAPDRLRSSLPARFVGLRLYVPSPAGWAWSLRLTSSLQSTAPCFEARRPPFPAHPPGCSFVVHGRSTVARAQLWWRADFLPPRLTSPKDAPEGIRHRRIPSGRAAAWGVNRNAAPLVRERRRFVSSGGAGLVCSHLSLPPPLTGGATSVGCALPVILFDSGPALFKTHWGRGDCWSLGHRFRAGREMDGKTRLSPRWRLEPL